MSRTHLGIILALILSFGMFQNIFAEDTKQTAANTEKYFFRILELSPNKGDFVLKQSDFDNSKVKLYQYTIREYNAIREDMVGRYDIVYLGNGDSDVGGNGYNYRYSYGYGYHYNYSFGYGYGNSSSDLEGYYTLGNPVKNIPAGGYQNDTYISTIDAYKPVYEFYPGNDATELVLGYLDEFHDAGHIVIADSVLYEYPAYMSRVYRYVQENSYVQKTERSDAINLIQSYTDYDTYTSVAAPRPYLEIISKPIEFDGSDDTYIDTSMNSEISSLDFEFTAMGYSADHVFDVNLYFDINGDNKYRESDGELIKSKKNAAASDRLTLTMALPENFKGIEPYKLEIVDLTTDTVNYETGYLAFRGDAPIVVNVLQVAPNGNTFNLATDLVGKNKENLLTAFEDDYIIHVDVLTVDEFTALYEDSDFTLTDYRGPDNDKSYNMIIFGFADVYGGQDISGEVVADDIKKFINTGQSVMFTHDVLTFYLNSNSGWGRNFTRYFRDYVAQNIYSDGDYPLDRYVTMGFSDMAYERAEGLGFKTSNNVYAFNDGIMTNYPFPLLSGSDEKEFYDLPYGSRLLDVAKTHYQYYELDLNDEDVVVWYTLADSDDRIDHLNPANYYYTYSIGNVTYSGTGHSDLDKANAFSERQLFVNTIIKAVRGANFAPEVTIQGVTDGDNIARSTESLTFSILAKDPDINDQYMNGTVYMDMNGDGQYSSSEIVAIFDADDKTGAEGSAIQNGVAKEVTLDLTQIDAELNQFSFKVVVTDTWGASGTRTSEHPLVDIPIISLEITGADGMLLGDKITLTTAARFTNPIASAETRIHGIGLTTGLYDDTSAYDISATNDYVVSGHESSYTISGKFLFDDIPDIENPEKDLVDQALGSWSFDLEAKSEGIFYLKSYIDYKLAFYGKKMTQESGKLFEARRGKLTYSLTDDLGVPMDEGIHGKLYFFESMDDVGDVDAPDISKGSIVYDGTISNSKITIGDDADELLKTGYYALVTEEKEQYGSTLSEAVYLDYTDSNKVIDIEIKSMQIKGFRWVHKGAADVADGIIVLDDSEIGASEIRFLTYSEFNTLSFAYDSDEADGVMAMSLEKITYIDEADIETDVTVKFAHDTESDTISWNDSGTVMPRGEYIFEFSHEFNDAAPDGSVSSYVLKKDIDVSLEDASSKTVTRTYSFPEVMNEALEFWKAMDIL